MASMSANDSVSCVARNWKAHSNVLRDWFHGWGPSPQCQRSACVLHTKEELALTRYSVVPHHRGLTVSHRLRLKRPGLRATSGSQAQSGWRPSWAGRPNRSETLARLSSPGSKQHDDSPEGLEPRTNGRKQNQSLPRMLPNTSNPDLHSSLPSNQRAAHFGAAHRRVRQQEVRLCGI